MAKKNFTGGMDLLLQGSKNNIENNKKADKEKSQSKTTKATYYFDTDTLQKIKAIAYYERNTIGEILNAALKDYIRSYETLEKALDQYKLKYPDHT
ncbi:MAG: hypothetical protein JEZ14_15290 [Marinilabiliaceae bacterium]|nr:hypothetical protein [Marinilabiliaceae bacterium]